MTLSSQLSRQRKIEERKNNGENNMTTKKKAEVVKNTRPRDHVTRL